MFIEIAYLHGDNDEISKYCLKSFTSYGFIIQIRRAAGRRLKPMWGHEDRKLLNNNDNFSTLQYTHL
jgi:hypothetical protein